MSSLRPVRGSAREISALLGQWHAADVEPEPIVIETSGSTGRPKRVVLSRAAMRASASATHDRLGGPGQWLLNLPASYVAGTQVLFRSVLAGTAPVVLDDHADHADHADLADHADHADLASAATAMTGARRYVSLVPTQLTRMLSSGRDVEALRGFDTILLGGARVDPGLRAAAEGLGLRLVATYGMSETCGGCVYDGVPLDGVAVALSPEGRIRLGGPVLFEGYDGQPELSAEVFDGSWFLTSDAGRFDEDGRLEVLGRIDDVVVSGGVNVPTPAVAARLGEHPAVSTAEVVGVPDVEWGQRVVAVVVLEPAHPSSDSSDSSDSSVRALLDDLRDFVGQTVPRAWAPRQLVVVPQLPLLGNGKVDRRAVEGVATSADFPPARQRLSPGSTATFSRLDGDFPPAQRGGGGR